MQEPLQVPLAAAVRFSGACFNEPRLARARIVASKGIGTGNISTGGKPDRGIESARYSVRRELGKSGEL